MRTEHVAFSLKLYLEIIILIITIKMVWHPVNARPQWPPGHRYGGPCLCKSKKRYVQPEIPTSFKPVNVYRPPDVSFTDRTTYKMSFEATDPVTMRHCRGAQIRQRESLTSAGDFSDKTTHKMSYGAWPGIKKPDLILPRHHKLIGDGPLSQLTTHKHDYTPKPIEAVDKIVHPGNLGFSSKPMENKTTANMSYQCPDYDRFEPSKSFKPVRSYLPPCGKIEDKTIHKLSFQPFEIPGKEDLPWQPKNKYSRPTVPFEGSTIYDNSYIPPGEFVMDTAGPGKCYCAYPGECFDSHGEPPKAHEYNICPIGYDPKKQPLPIAPSNSYNQELLGGLVGSSVAPTLSSPSSKLPAVLENLGFFYKSLLP